MYETLHVDGKTKADQFYSLERSIHVPRMQLVKSISSPRRSIANRTRREIGFPVHIAQRNFPKTTLSETLKRRLIRQPVSPGSASKLARQDQLLRRKGEVPENAR